MPSPVAHFELTAKDPAKLRTFFTKLFNWGTEDYPDMGYTMLHTAEKVGINGGLGAASAELPPGLAIYVQVENVDRALGEALTLGASGVLQAPNDIPGIGRFAMFLDPEGNRIGLWQLATEGN